MVKVKWFWESLLHDAFDDDKPYAQHTVKNIAGKVLFLSSITFNRLSCMVKMLWHGDLQRFLQRERWVQLDVRMKVQ